MEGNLKEQMKDLVVMTMQAVRKKLNAEERDYCYEIFGYDFIIDEGYKAWLIEVNTNPCLEESSSLLKMILPRMVGNLPESPRRRHEADLGPGIPQKAQSGLSRARGQRLQGERLLGRRKPVGVSASDRIRQRTGQQQSPCIQPLPPATKHNDCAAASYKG